MNWLFDKTVGYCIKLCLETELNRQLAQQYAKVERLKCLIARTAMAPDDCLRAAAEAAHFEASK